jgi:hypothetical protein
MAHESNVRNGWKFTFKVFNERSCTFTLWGHVPVNCERDNVKRKGSKSCVSCNITAAPSKHIHVTSLHHKVNRTRLLQYVPFEFRTLGKHIPYVPCMSNDNYSLCIKESSFWLQGKMKNMP